MKFYYTSCQSFCTCTESITYMMYTVDQAFLQSYDLTPPSPPLSLPQCRPMSRIIRPRESLVLYTSYINHSIFSFYSMYKCMHTIHTVHVKSVTSIYVRTYIFHTCIQERVKNVLIFYYIL
jgi:hypothetical protein